MCCNKHYKDFETIENQVETIKYTPEKAKQNALAKLDLICKWQEFRRKAVNKLQAVYSLCYILSCTSSGGSGVYILAISLTFNEG